MKEIEKHTMSLQTVEFFFDEEVVTALHDDLIDQIGGIKGIRDTGLLSSALSAPFQSFGGYEIYQTI